MDKISSEEIGDLIESVDWFTRNYHSPSTCNWQSNNHGFKGDIPGPMGPTQVMKSLGELIVEYTIAYKHAYLTIPLPRFLQRFRRAKS